MRFLAFLGVGLLVLALLFGAFVYLLLPGLIGSRLAASLQESYGLDEPPNVEVTSGFPPELLLGRIDGIQVSIDRLQQEGVALQNVRVDLANVDVSVPGLLQGDFEREIDDVALRAEVTEEELNAYLRESETGLPGGELAVDPGGLVYQSEDILFGLPASVNLDLQVAGPYAIQVIPTDPRVSGISLPTAVEGFIDTGSRVVELDELPLGTELESVEPGRDALVVQAGR